MLSLAFFFIGPRLPCFGSPASTLTSDPKGEAAAFPRVQMRDVWSLPPAEVAIASILAAGLWALQTRS
jgi:hypothetical protein